MMPLCGRFWLVRDVKYGGRSWLKGRKCGRRNLCEKRFVREEFVGEDYEGGWELKLTRDKVGREGAREKLRC